MDVGGKPVVADLTRMPHLLVAGATGSGKSVCINSLITSLLVTRTPDEVQFIMIDPKQVELSQYRGLPHLRLPVVTDMEKVVAALRWTVLEMERRYGLFADVGARNIVAFNDRFPDERLVYLVVVIDELADMMMTAAEDVERLICRLAQLGRAAGVKRIASPGTGLHEICLSTTARKLGAAGPGPFSAKVIARPVGDSRLPARIKRRATTRAAETWKAKTSASASPIRPSGLRRRQPHPTAASTRRKTRSVWSCLAVRGFVRTRLGVFAARETCRRLDSYPEPNE